MKTQNTTFTVLEVLKKKHKHKHKKHKNASPPLLVQRLDAFATLGTRMKRMKITPVLSASDCLPTRLDYQRRRWLQQKMQKNVKQR